jgi:transcriptional regulator with XRE-family HTH domain
MNQFEFAKKLDMAQTSYSKIETGENKLTDKNISLICYVFGVNEA